MKITIISDTHNKHKTITNNLYGGDILIHAGDISSMGYEHEIESFCKWFDSIDNYDIKIFIAGNHDWGFQNNVEKVNQIVNSYKSITYLQDESMDVGIGDSPLVKLYGSPWQPEFYNWAFNLPKNGEELKSKWNEIPGKTDILITHGPAYGFLDDVTGRRGQHLGCELLRDRVLEIKPKIHVCGHIHTGWGHYFDGHTHFFNASVLDERYIYTQTPWDIEWDPITNEVKFL
jgi:Icc-related predicted phosphoesterase